MTGGASRVPMDAIPEPHSIPARALGKIVDTARPRGGDIAALFHALGIDRSVLADEEARIPFAAIVSFYDHAARLTGDDAFGLHVGEASNPSMFDVVGYATMNSPTVAEALTRLIRYQRVWTDGSLWYLSLESSTARLEYAYQISGVTPEECRHDCEASLAIFVAGMRALVRSDWKPREVWFAHRSPRDLSEHHRVFGAPLSFGQSVNAVLFDRSALDLPVVEADPRLCAVLDRHANALLARLPSGGRFVDKVRQALSDALRCGDPGPDAVARTLAMSVRTLQRKLKSEGTSLQDLLEAMRRNLSVRYLQRDDLSVAEVAYLLGFSEPSSFHRAFRKWTGVTPGEFRRARSVANNVSE